MELRSGRLMALAAAAGMAGEWAAVPDDLEKMAQAKLRDVRLRANAELTGPRVGHRSDE
jgi:hypothetical protein